MQILIVEDDAILALMTAEALTIFGYRISGPAHTVDEALQIAAKEKIDLAFVDINLAGHDEGIELARELRARYGIRALFLSGQVVVARSNHDAALGLLAKPYLLEDLNRSIQYVQAYMDGKNPPPPAKPSKLELFAAH